MSEITEKKLLELSSQVGKRLKSHGLTLATAESCTGGQLGHILTCVSGSSEYFMGGVIAYSNTIKETVLDVKVETLKKYGAVSSQTAKEMANGIRRRFKTDIGIATTGIAGPTGGTPEKPVGLVWIGISTREETIAIESHFEGDRSQVKSTSVHQCLTLLLEKLNKNQELENSELLANKKKKILILTGDAGMGHRSAAEAVKKAFEIKYGEQATAIIKNPLNHPDVPDVIRNSQSDYDAIVKRLPELYKLGYDISDSKLPVTLMEGGFSVLLTNIIKEIITENNPDIIITTYPIYIAPLTSLKKSKKIQFPIFTVVTDLATVHRVWFNNGVTRCTVPTETVAELALNAGLTDTQIINTGIPVDPEIADLKQMDINTLRSELGWEQNLPTVLVVGSPRIPQLIELIHTLDVSGHELQFALVAGGNESLLSDFNSTTWRHPVKIYDFVDHMPKLMRAADMIICKAGGLIVTESLASGLPLMLVHVLPGQETGNANFVIENETGALCKTPLEALETLFDWFKDGCTKLQKMAENAEQFGRPQAANEIVDEAWRLLE
jgi:1,2-diacylglycerol 3-beta-galactosyltransferase